MPLFKKKDDMNKTNCKAGIVPKQINQTLKIPWPYYYENNLGQPIMDYNFLSDLPSGFFTSHKILAPKYD